MAISAKGREVSIDALRAANRNMVALGNANLNANGDLIDKKGKVLKTREELSLEYNTKMVDSVTHAPVSGDTPIVRPVETAVAEQEETAPVEQTEEVVENKKSKKDKSSTEE